MKGRLHITNGDQAAKAIVSAGLATEVLPWRDVLHDGPVPCGLKLNELSRVRADFLASIGGGTPDDLRTEFTTRDAIFGLAAEHGRITLWFESDLYDQLQLAQVLAELFQAHSPFDGTTLVAFDGSLGRTPPAGITTAHETGKKLTMEHFEVACEMWDAFRETQPARLVKLASRDYPVLPYMAAAIRRLFREFPHVGTGLTGIQTSVMAILKRGSKPPGSLFSSIAELEERIFLGDASFATYLEDLSKVPHPLVTFDDGSPVIAPGRVEPAPDFWHRKIALTDVGAQVLAGSADHVALNGIDRWIGGVHLTATHQWRWDEGAQTVVSA